VQTAVIFYEAAKDWLVATTAITKDAWHLYFALLIQLAVAQLFRRRLASVGPLLVLAALEFLNEYMDFQHYHIAGADPLLGWAPDTARDVVNSLLLPTILFLAARFRPDRLLEARAPAPAPEVTTDED